MVETFFSTLNFYIRIRKFNQTFDINNVFKNNNSIKNNMFSLGNKNC